MEVSFLKDAEKFLNKQSEKQSERIKRAIHQLPKGDVKKLRGLENAYRLRIGEIRVLFERKNDTITVIKIDSRGDIYK